MVFAKLTMKLFVLFLAVVSLTKADHARALNLLSRCQPETRFLDIRLASKDGLDDITMEGRKKIMHDQSGRFFTAAIK